MDNVIEINNLSKKYTITHEAKGAYNYAALRDVVTDGAKNLWKKAAGNKDAKRPTREEIWALKDISLNIKQGERIGVIGRNGAGKSTLLKILSRITEPTEGYARLRGRVSSLLEVGTGFHPELTGSENIYLNGAVLGMKKAEIEAKFDEIVDFSGVETFLDTPVKRFSSGMQVRLAFAVAAHLEPEILLIDEVLAVGDAEFQKKCLGKMDEVSRQEGRTIVFVSHNMGAISNLCQRAVLLDKGRIIAIGDTKNVINNYLQGFQVVETYEQLEQAIKKIPPDPVFQLKSIRLFQSGCRRLNTVANGDPLEIEISYKVLKKTTGLRVYLDLCDNEDTLLFRSFHDEQADGIPTMPPGEYVSKAVIPSNVLGPTIYNLYIRAGIYNVRNCMRGIKMCLNVINSGEYNKAYRRDVFRGKIGLSLSWETM